MLKKYLCIVATAAALTGCASPYKDLPVLMGTIVYSQPSQRKEFTPSLGAAAAGAAVGGVAGNQIGKGNGRKFARIAGILGGAAVGATVGGSTTLVPTSLVTFRDNVSNQHYHGMVDGQWSPGMAIAYSEAPDGTIIVR